MNKKEFEEKYILQLTFDKPITFNGIQFFPIPMEKYYEFNACSYVLKIKKDRIPDAKIISMSYMEYLIKIIEEERGELNDIGNVTSSLVILLSIATRSDNNLSLSIVTKDNKKKIKINDSIFTSSDFNTMKDIILFQNDPNYTGIEMNEELENEIMAANEIKNYGKHSCSLEEIIISLTIGTSLSFSDIYNMSIRKFFKVVTMKDKEMSYKILKTAEMSGFVKFDKEPLHYLETKDSTWDEGKIYSYDSLKNKLSGYSKS